ncbi:hypothetical protein CR969_00060 [Candidatus Saccharibacteria bacterium]|nr:MAG: hypothetical protein CR969_00060 [Candidatus Saccharibacteria bacterium]
MSPKENLQLPNPIREFAEQSNQLALDIGQSEAKIASQRRSQDLVTGILEGVSDKQQFNLAIVSPMYGSKLQATELADSIDAFTTPVGALHPITIGNAKDDQCKLFETIQDYIKGAIANLGQMPVQFEIHQIYTDDLSDEATDTEPAALIVSAKIV